MEAIKIENLHFSRKQRKLFSNLTLSIPQGQFIGLLGPNGTGKSTLLKLMAGILQALPGSNIHLLGQPLQQLKPIEAAKLISYMPQTTHLDANYTVEQVVRMGRFPHKKRFSNWNDEDSIAIADALDFTGVAYLKDRLVPSLSGGERQLVYLAKAIAQETPILLLDEPTSDLDIHHQVLVTSILHQLVAQGKTVIAAIHDINLASRICDQCLFLKDGEILAFGRNENVVNEENLDKTFQVKSHIYEEQFTNTKQIIPYEVQS